MTNKLSERALVDFHKYIDTLNFDGYHFDAVQLDKRFLDWLNEDVIKPNVIVGPHDNWPKVTRWTLYVEEDEDDIDMPLSM